MMGLSGGERLESCLISWTGISKRTLGTWICWTRRLERRSPVESDKVVGPGCCNNHLYPALGVIVDQFCIQSDYLDQFEKSDTF
jgi:hypothetical protein